MPQVYLPSSIRFYVNQYEEALASGTLHGEFVFPKAIIALRDRYDRLVTLEGNHALFTARMLQLPRIQAVLLETEEDFDFIGESDPADSPDVWYWRQPDFPAHPYRDPILSRYRKVSDQAPDMSAHRLLLMRYFLRFRRGYYDYCLLKHYLFRGLASQVADIHARYDRRVDPATFRYQPRAALSTLLAGHLDDTEC